MDKNFYANVAEDKRESGGYDKTKIEFFIKQVGTGKNILDVACNDGYIGEMLIKKGNTVYGFDIVQKNLKIAKKKGLKVKCFDLASGLFPYPSDLFDVVILGDIIEHVFDIDKLLGESRRVLKKGGKLLLTTPNVASLGRRLMLLLGISPFLEYSLKLSTNGLPSVGHIRYYTVKTLKEQLAYNGFKDIQVKGNGIHLPSPFSKLFSYGQMYPSFCSLLISVSVKN